MSSLRHRKVPLCTPARLVGRWRLPRRIVLVCVFLAALALATAGNAASATMHVDENNPNCSNGGSGSASQPFCTIGAAATRATGGTTVLVHAGTYGEQVSPRSGAVNSPVVFAAAPGETVTVMGQTYGFYVSGKSWVTIQGFNVTDTVSDGIHISSGSSNVTVIGNRVSSAGAPVSGQTAKGISVTDVTDVLVQNNMVDHNSNYGIYLVNATRIKIDANEIAFNAKVYSRAASGIRLHSSDSNTISSNVSHHNEDSGIEIVTGSDGNLVVNNVTHDNGDHGIDILEARNQRVVSNSVYNNVTAGINAEGTSTGTTLANNISVDNGINSPRTRGNIRVDSASISGTAIDYDLVHLGTSGTMLVWGSTSYSSLSAFAAATGQESHGIQATPLWENVASRDLHLKSGSPAIDSANSGASGQSATDVDGNPRVDDPQTPNTGAGPRAYDDRGAYEYGLHDLPPNAALTVTPASGLVDLTVTADASGSTDNDGTSPIESYTFDFGDGSPAVGPQPEATAPHAYTAAGVYTVTVTVRDTAGVSSSATQQVTVTDNPPAATLTVTPPSGPAPLVVEADASASTDTDGTPIESYTFDFGDGSPAVGPQSQPTASHIYTTGGTYTVTVTVSDEAGLSSQATQQVSVSFGIDDPPTAALTVTPSSGPVDLDVIADASGSTDDDVTSPIESYTFDFGDGAPAVGPQPGATAAHTYTAAGTYTVTVTVRDTAGLSSTATAQVVVADNPPSATLSVQPSSGVAPLSVVADASGSTEGNAPIASYTFDFGDGSTAVGPQTGATATHTYTAGGTYTVTVTVTDEAGQSSTATSQVSAIANLVLNPGFETNLSGWNTSGSGTGITLTRVAGGHSGNWAAKLTNTGTSGGTCLLNDSPDWARPTSAGTYQGSLWVRADAPGKPLKLRFREYVGSTLVGSATTQLTLTNSWQQVVVTYTVVSPGSTLDFNAYLAAVDAPPGSCFYVDDAVISRL